MSQAYALTTTPARLIPGRLVVTCPCGDGINTPNTPVGGRLLEDFTANHECEDRTE